jgi:hypothetical protein
MRSKPVLSARNWRGEGGEVREECSVLVTCVHGRLKGISQSEKAASVLPPPRGQRNWECSGSLEYQGIWHGQVRAGGKTCMVWHEADSPLITVFWTVPRAKIQVWLVGL